MSVMVGAAPPMHAQMHNAKEDKHCTCICCIAAFSAVSKLPHDVRCYLGQEQPARHMRCRMRTAHNYLATQLATHLCARSSWSTCGAGEQRARLTHFMLRSSTSKMRVALGGMTCSTYLAIHPEGTQKYFGSNKQQRSHTPAAPRAP